MKFKAQDAMSKKSVEIPQYVESGATAVNEIRSKLLIQTFEDIIDRLKKTATTTISQEDYLYC